MHSYKRIYIFLKKYCIIVMYNLRQKVRIFFGEICVFLSIILYQIKKRGNHLPLLLFMK